MSTPNTITAPISIQRPLAGNLFLKETVQLADKADGSARSMGVLQVATDEGIVRVTDFSKQHEKLVEGQSIRLVYEETQGVRNERPVTFRNLITAVQA